MITSAAHHSIFAANRAIGRIDLSVVATPTGSRRSRVCEAGSLRVRFPNGSSEGGPDAMIVNTAGGMTGGDRFNIGITVGADAHLTVTTAAAEKIYRSLGADTQIGMRFDVASRGTLMWLPQETILFDRVRLRRTIDVDLVRDAKLLLTESIVFGRSAMGEAVLEGRLIDCWRVRVDGALVFAETIRLDGAISRQLKRAAVARDGVAVASVFQFPANDANIDAIHAKREYFVGEVGISAWNGFAVARLVAPNGALLRHDLVGVLSALSNIPLPRSWLN